jgi:alkylation response protein AidB-like acyl-CoA dehydrogenase
MDFDLSPAEQEMVQSVKGVLPESDVAFAPMKGMFVADSMEELLDLAKRLAGAGYLHADPGSAGGGPLGLAAEGTMLATFSPETFLALEFSSRVVGGVLAGFGSHQVQTDLLKQMESGDLLAATTLNVAGLGESAEIPAVTTQKMEQGWRTDGEADLVVNGPLAGLVALPARAGEEWVWLLLDPVWPGLVLGPRLETTSLNKLTICSVTLRDLEVPFERVMGPFSAQDSLARAAQMQTRALTICALGLMRRSFKWAVAGAKETGAGGRPLIAQQNIAFKLAEMHTLSDTARLLAYRALWAGENDEADAAMLADCAKVFCSEAAETVASQALQVLGARGFMAGNPAEESYRAAKFLTSCGGSSEAVRMNIGDRVLATY